MGRIGFYQPQERLRRPIYSLAGRKLCYVEGNRITRLDGQLVAIILRSKATPEVTENCVASSTMPAEPDQQYEV